jgi:hypothetical protein
MVITLNTKQLPEHVTADSKRVEIYLKILASVKVFS